MPLAMRMELSQEVSPSDEQEQEMAIDLMLMACEGAIPTHRVHVESPAHDGPIFAQGCSQSARKPSCQ